MSLLGYDVKPGIYRLRYDRKAIAFVRGGTSGHVFMQGKGGSWVQNDVGTFEANFILIEADDEPITREWLEKHFSPIWRHEIGNWWYLEEGNCLAYHDDESVTYYRHDAEFYFKNVKTVGDVRRLAVFLGIELKVPE